MKAARKFNATDTQINELGYQKQSQLNNVGYEFMLEQHSLNEYIVEP